VITTPPTRLTDPHDCTGPRTVVAGTCASVEPVSCAGGGRKVTAAQVDRAVLQLRERPGQTAVEQVQAVLRALDLTVVPNP
jgi:hypothetical protein